MSGIFRAKSALVSRPRIIIPNHTSSTRSVSTATQFYQNRQLELYASKEAKRLTLRQLVRSTGACLILEKVLKLGGGIFRTFDE
jgi:hypothetical protein